MRVTTTITAPFRRRLLWRGALLGGAGIVVLAYTGSQWDLTQLQRWGWLVFWGSMLFITLGLLPYRKILRLEKEPNELHLGEEKVGYCMEGKIRCTIPLGSIKEVAYLSTSSSYGIALFLHAPLPQPIRIQDPHFPIRRWLQKSQQKYRCDFFLPYFSRRACRNLQDWCTPLEELDT